MGGDDLLQTCGYRLTRERQKGMIMVLSNRLGMRVKTSMESSLVRGYSTLIWAVDMLHNGMRICRSGQLEVKGSSSLLCPISPFLEPAEPVILRRGGTIIFSSILRDKRRIPLPPA